MGFLTSFPPYLSPCSLSTFFKRQKQRRKTSLPASPELQNGGNHQEQEREPQIVAEQVRVEKQQFRRRVITVGPISIMQSFNRHIKKQSVARPAKKEPPAVLSAFEVVPVFECRLSNRSVSNRNRQEVCSCCPIARSGHRIFSDQNFIYVVGGYNQILSNDKTYQDCWRFNRLTQQWQQCALADSAKPLPSTLASFSLMSLLPAFPTMGSNEVYIFGGTGFPFGQKATNQLHRLRIDANGKIHIQLQEKESSAAEPAQQDDNGNQPIVPQFPPRMYGHSMCYRMESDDKSTLNEVIYLAGGTTGHIYNMDIWRLQRPAHSHNAPWKAALLNMNGFETGRYRLETILYGQMIYTFGGGAPDFVAEFNELLCFNLCSRKFELVKTQPDPVFGVPAGRKCHALVQNETTVYLIGGCRDTQVDRGYHHQITNDVWKFDLDTLQWTQLRTNLPIPVYFHSAAITPDGCIFVFGGCVNEEDSQAQTRVNCLQRLWLRPPSLKYFASTTLLRNLPKTQRQRITNDGIRLEDTEALIARLSEALAA